MKYKALNQKTAQPTNLPAPPADVVAPVEDLVSLRHLVRDMVFFPRLRPQSAAGGLHRTRFRGRGMDFDEVRPYQAGDDMRNIDWRVTARTQITHTKLFREERERPVYILGDLRQSMFFGSQRMKSVVASEVCAALAWAGLNNADKVGGLIFGSDQSRDIRARRSHHSALSLIRVLHETGMSLCQPKTDTYTLEQMLQELRRIAPPGAALMLVSDFHDISADERNERHLFDMARHCDITLFHIFDPLEASLPPPGNYALSGPGGRRSLDTRSTRQRHDFERAFEKQRNHLQSLAIKMGFSYLSFPEGNPSSSSMKNNETVSILNRYYGKNRRPKTRTSQNTADKTRLSAQQPSQAPGIQG